MNGHPELQPAFGERNLPCLLPEPKIGFQMKHVEPPNVGGGIMV